MSACIKKRKRYALYWKIFFGNFTDSSIKRVSNIEFYNRVIYKIVRNILISGVFPMLLRYAKRIIIKRQQKIFEVHAIQ